EVKQAKLKKDETIARYSNGVVIGKWKDKREVAHISTEFKNNLIVSTDKRGHNKTKPERIVNYNKFKSGIDRQDQMQSYYPSTRKTIRCVLLPKIPKTRLLSSKVNHVSKKNTKLEKWKSNKKKMSTMLYAENSKGYGIFL
ncbi:piggyBac transposable element-derived protein 4-like, partial [Aphis craccivora]